MREAHDLFLISIIKSRLELGFWAFGRVTKIYECPELWLATLGESRALSPSPSTTSNLTFPALEAVHDWSLGFSIVHFIQFSSPMSFLFCLLQTVLGQWAVGNFLSVAVLPCSFIPLTYWYICSFCWMAVQSSYFLRKCTTGRVGSIVLTTIISTCIGCSNWISGKRSEVLLCYTFISTGVGDTTDGRTLNLAAQSMLVVV